MTLEQVRARHAKLMRDGTGVVLTADDFTLDGIATIANDRAFLLAELERRDGQVQRLRTELKRYVVYRRWGPNQKVETPPVLNTVCDICRVECLPGGQFIHAPGCILAQCADEGGG